MFPLLVTQQTVFRGTRLVVELGSKPAIRAGVMEGSMDFIDFRLGESGRVTQRRWPLN